VQHVWIVIHDKNVCWIHFVTYLVPERPSRERE
jgi:hypothetical protein